MRPWAYHRGFEFHTCDLAVYIEGFGLMSGSTHKRTHKMPARGLNPPCHRRQQAIGCSASELNRDCGGYEPRQKPS